MSLEEICRRISSLQSGPGDVERVRALLQAGADPNARDNANRTAIFECSSREVAEILAGAGADLEAKDRFDSTALELLVVLRNRASVIEFLLERGADPNRKKPHGVTPLQNACLNGRMENVRLLLQHGADPNARDKKGKSVLSVASEEGHRDIVAMLEEHGAKRRADTAAVAATPKNWSQDPRAFMRALGGWFRGGD